MQEFLNTDFRIFKDSDTEENLYCLNCKKHTNQKHIEKLIRGTCVFKCKECGYEREYYFGYPCVSKEEVEKNYQYSKLPEEKLDNWFNHFRILKKKELVRAVKNCNEPFAMGYIKFSFQGLMSYSTIFLASDVINNTRLWKKIEKQDKENVYLVLLNCKDYIINNHLAKADFIVQ